MHRLALALPDLTGIGRLPADIAWQLLESVFGQRTALLVGALTSAMLGTAGYVGTGSGWYLAGLVYTVVVATWRFSQVCAFSRARESATPVVWAFRSLASGAATAAGWAAWTSMVLFEPDKSLVGIALAIHAGLITGGAIRNNAVKVIAVTQTCIASPPLLVACILSPNHYMHVYAGIVGIHFMAALSLARFLHEQTVRLLVSQQQSRELAAKLAGANEELALVNEHLEEQVGLDPLTELPNRRAFDFSAARHWRIAARDATPLAVMMIDVDYFKLFNDHYGHPAGDACLQLVAATLTGVLRRQGDLLARYGGEEFIAVLPSTDAQMAVKLAERMLQALADRALEHARAPLGRISISIGLACADTVHDRSLKELIAQADAALYVAKRSGRNRAELHQSRRLQSVRVA